MRRLGGWSVLMLVAIVTSCTRVNAAHCGNQDGDPTCVERGGPAYCDLCTAENDGCVADLPSDPTCRKEEWDSGVADDHTSTSAESSASSKSTTDDEDSASS